MKLFLYFFLIFSFACNGKQTKINIIKNPQKNKVSKIDNVVVSSNKIDSLTTEILETFVDSLHIGKKGKCKVELIKYSGSDHNYTKIKFYTFQKKTRKSNKKWIIRSNYVFENDAISGLDTNISDFNNDNFNDMTFISATAARGANEVRRLFIYDDKKQKLISITNSEDYPNMLYNKGLNCIDAFLVYGGCSTVFLKIQGDSLKKIARIESFDDLTVSTFDKKDVEKIIFKKRGVNENYIRYKNFRPLKKYKGN